MSDLEFEEEEFADAKESAGVTTRFFFVPLLAASASASSYFSSLRWRLLPPDLDLGAKKDVSMMLL